MLEEKYILTVNNLYTKPESKQEALEVIKDVFSLLRSYARKHTFTAVDEKVILAQGEIMSVAMMTALLNERGLKAVALPALEFMKTNADADPDMAHIENHIKPLLDAAPEAEIFITQGFICRNAAGEVDNLQRGGSDYTASIIGAAVNADEIEIWTDIDGMHNNDPRFVEKTRPVHNLHLSLIHI